jgi:hypothetical protein
VCAAHRRGLARRAFRRPVSAAETERARRDLPARAGVRDVRVGIEAVLRRMLASPSFVFRPEIEPAGTRPATRSR